MSNNRTNNSVQNNNETKQFKIVMIGDGGCGKTVFLNRFLNGEFEKRYLATLGAEVFPVPLFTTKGEVELVVWSTAGQEKFGGLREGYYHDAHYAIVFFDVTSRITFKNVDQWVNDFKRICPNTPIVYVGNKVDVRERKVKVTEIQEKLKGKTYFDISAKSCYNIEKPFLKVVRKLLNDNTLEFVESPAIEPPVVLPIENKKIVSCL